MIQKIPIALLLYIFITITSKLMHGFHVIGAFAWSEYMKTIQCKTFRTQYFIVRERSADLGEMVISQLTCLDAKSLIG